MAAIDQYVTDRIIEARESAGLTRADFAEKLGLSKQGYHHYEKRTSTYSIEQIFRAAQVLGRPVGWFLGLAPAELDPEEQQLISLLRYLDLDSEDVAAAFEKAPPSGMLS